KDSGLAATFVRWRRRVTARAVRYSDLLTLVGRRPLDGLLATSPCPKPRHRKTLHSRGFVVALNGIGNRSRAHLLDREKESPNVLFENRIALHRAYSQCRRAARCPSSKSSTRL